MRNYLCCLLLFAFGGCSNTQNETNGAVAKTYCASCHIFPEPDLLDKKTWEKGIFPRMGPMLGIRYMDGQPYADISYNDKESITKGAISMDDWKKIMTYYITLAPDSSLVQNRPPIKDFTNLFTAKEPALQKGNCSVSYIKIDPGNKYIYQANGFDSSLTIYNNQLQKITSKNIHNVPVDISFEQDITQPGKRSGVLTGIGIMNPNDLAKGSAENITITKEGSFAQPSRLFDSMRRPVQTTLCDLNNDGKTDYLVCGFGNTVGEFYWMKNNGNGTYEKKMLAALPGAIKAYIRDFNNDGLPDIIALFAQAREGVFLFTNKGNGAFEKKDLLLFPPVYGSSYFELDDFNNDGFPDILYTCGDNADYSNVLKNFHGVYIFLNDGKNNYKQKYFFPVHGAFKAMAKDFDKDGDLDIAAIAFFPDKLHQPQESFVYLQNNGNYSFKPFGIPQYNKGNWLTMDAADIDGDGDDDIVIGSLSLAAVRNNINNDSLNKNPRFLLLQNNTK